jgi:hypothetical protein
MGGGYPAGNPVERFTGAGAYAQQGRVLPDDSDISSASVADLVVTYCTVMDNMTRTNNTGSLADLGRYVSLLWQEMIRRGVEFK